MADISSYTSAILTAIYGRDVRQALVDALNKVNDDNNSYQSIKTEILKAKTDIEATVTAFNTAVTNAQTAKSELQFATSSANTAQTNLNKVITSAGTSETNLEEAITNSNTAKRNLETAITNANTTKEAAERAKTALDDSIRTGNTLLNNLGVSIDNARTAKSNLDGSINTAVTAKSNLDTTITNAGNSKSELETVIINAGNSKSELSSVITAAEKVKGELSTIINTGDTLLKNIQGENTRAEANITALQSENFKSDEILTGVDDIKAYLGYVDEDVVGVQIDYKNKTTKRLAGAYGLSKGSDFDKFPMFGGRKRCVVSDTGIILAFHGDEGYIEDGSAGQVMVYQPEFFYKVVPLEMELQSPTSNGYVLRKANYYVSSKAKPGFKRHPAFYDENGNEIRYIFLSAYEGSIYDVSEGAFLLGDEQIGNFAASTGDKFCSIAGAKPASGKTQGLTRPNLEQICKNRGTGWHSDNIKAESANQILMIIELGMMNTQTGVGNGVVSVPDNPNTENNSIVTGGTSNLGNITGMADGTNGQVSVTYRGVENPWGNIWKFVYGVNIHGNGSQGSGIPYICTDYNYAESKNSGNYESAGFILSNANGYVSAMAYNEKYDWLFFPAETIGNSSVPVGDYYYCTPNLNGYRIALLGGRWNDGGIAGGFYWSLGNGVGYRHRLIGGRLVYVPDYTSEAYTQSYEVWVASMAA